MCREGIRVNIYMITNYNDLFPLIVDKVKYHKNGKPFLSQRLKIKCNNCPNFLYLKLRQLIPKTTPARCKSCLWYADSTNIQRLRNNASNQKNKTYEEMYGSKSKTIKEKLSAFMKTTDRTNCINALKQYNAKRKGKEHRSWEEMWGKEIADIKKETWSKKYKGKNNPMFGKPTPKKAGNGVCGWYKRWFFRSLHELSFMINYIEKNQLSWSGAENVCYSIPYINYDGGERTYYADFILNGNMMIEVKPYKLINTPAVLLKKAAGERFCREHNMTYQIFSEKDFEKLTDKQVKTLFNEEKIKLVKNKHIEYILSI